MDFNHHFEESRTFLEGILVCGPPRLTVLYIRSKQVLFLSVVYVHTNTYNVCLCEDLAAYRRQCMTTVMMGVGISGNLTET